MTAEEKDLLDQRSARIRRVKRWLRPLPRRATIHKYPVLGRFAETARRRIYLWSFREENAVPAIYAGCILTLMPIYGIQLPLSFLLALWLRANLPILAGLQMVSNPVTALPIWFAGYNVGRNVLGVIGVEALRLERAEVRQLLGSFLRGEWGSKLERIASVFGVTSLGAVVMGTFFGLVASVAYRIIARRTAASYAVLLQKLQLHRDHRTKPPPPSMPPSE
ncbi:MAG: DUF2062 domain-containing protein [Verrucomicrobiota bacterium]